MMLAVVLFIGCTRARTVQKTETIMGTDVTITVVAPSTEEGEAAIEAGMAELRRLDAMMSLYKDTSEITKVNLAAGKDPVKVSPEMIEVVEQAAEISRLSGGVFDVTIGPLVVLWQMRLKEGKVPTDEEIARVRPLVNYRNIVIDRKASTIFLKKPGMIMDFGGMKGYMADRVAELFRKRGIKNAIIAVAGDIWVLGHREDGSRPGGSVCSIRGSMTRPWPSWISATNMFPRPVIMNGSSSGKRSAIITSSTPGQGSRRRGSSP